MRTDMRRHILYDRHIYFQMLSAKRLGTFSLSARDLLRVQAIIRSNEQIHVPMDNIDRETKDRTTRAKKVQRRGSREGRLYALVSAH